MPPTAYVAAVAAGGRRRRVFGGFGASGLKVVHTALHGVGDVTLREVLAVAGWPAPIRRGRPAAARPRLPDRALPQPGGAGRA